MTDATDNKLRNFIDQIERANDSVKAEQEARRDIYAAAKAEGYDPRIIKAVIKLKEDPAKAAETEQLIDTYAAAIGLEA